MNNKVKCSRIEVDCVKNDPVDIRCGGPEYLGFVFSVKEKETEEMKKFISVTLESFKVPLISIYVSKTYNGNPKYLWDKSAIVECIQKDAEYLIGEAARDYGNSYTKK